MEMTAKVKDEMWASRGARRTVIAFAVICAVALLLATRGIPWRTLVASAQFPLLLTAVSTLAAAIAALATCAQAMYARATAQHLATRELESSGTQPLAATPAAEYPEWHALDSSRASVVEYFLECLLSEHTASALAEEMRVVGADAVTASANLRVAEIRNRKLTEYAFLSLAYAALCGVAPPTPPALKP
jgi:hypothetical protein